MKQTKTLAVLLILIFMLTACGGSTPATTAAPTTTVAAPETEAQNPLSIKGVLDFLKEGEIYVDYKVDAAILKDFSVKIDGKALEKPGKASFTKDSIFEVNGEGNNSDQLFVYVIAEKKQEDGSFVSDNQYFNKIFADKAAEGIMQILKTLRSDRMYVAILTEGNGFDQNLSKGLTAILDQFYQGIK